MKIISIGRFTQKLDYKTNTQNYETWTAMSEYFDEIYIVVESPDGESHFEKLGKLNVYWIANHGSGFGRLQFIEDAYKLSVNLVKEQGIEVIDASEPLGGIVAVRIKKHFHMPITFQVQAQLLNLPPDTFSWTRRTLVRSVTGYICKRADRVRAVSAEIAQSIIDYGIPDSKVFLARCRCNTEVFDPSLYSEKRAELRAKYGCADDALILVFCGSLIKTKDPESVIIALHQLLQSDKRYQLLMAGDGVEKEPLLKMIEALGISKNVRLLGRIPFSDIPEFLSVGDYFVLSSTNEGMPRSVLEAMAMELPVIVTPVGGNPEAVANGETGMIVPVKSPDSIAAAIQELSSNDELRKKMGKAAREKVLMQHEMKSCIRDFANIILCVKEE